MSDLCWLTDEQMGRLATYFPRSHGKPRVDGDARAIQLDVTDHASVAAAAARIRDELGRLDVLIQDAAISNTGMKPGQTFQDYAQTVTAGEPESR